MDKDNIMNYSINTIDIDMYITWYGNNAKCVLKNELFPGYENKRSIKHFKTFKEFYSKLVENEKIAA